MYHLFEIWRPVGSTCLGWKFGHQAAPLPLVENFATRWCHLQFALLEIWPPGGFMASCALIDSQLVPHIYIESETEHKYSLKYFV